MSHVLRVHRKPFAIIFAASPLCAARVSRDQNGRLSPTAFDFENTQRPRRFLKKRLFVLLAVETFGFGGFCFSTTYNSFWERGKVGELHRSVKSGRSRSGGSIPSAPIGRVGPNPSVISSQGGVSMQNVFTPAIHVRFAGQSQRLNFAHIGLPANATDGDIKEAVARNLEVAASTFKFHVVERHDNGNITVRPEAVFG